MCPEICVCSFVALSTAGGGASSCQHLSGGEAFWYTTCALLALVAPNQRFALNMFLFDRLTETELNHARGRGGLALLRRTGVGPNEAHGWGGGGWR